MATIGKSLGQKAVNKLSGGQLGTYPNPGLSMRFAVTVDALTDLGLWQSCTGLQVDMKYKYVEAGGDYTSLTPLPERITWQPVTLARAMQRSTSLQVWNWLDEYISNWASDPSESSIPEAGTASITLLDYQLNPLLEWTLSDVRPVKWVGPSLSATESKIAIEQLILEHQGFTCTSPSSTGL